VTADKRSGLSNWPSLAENVVVVAQGEMGHDGIFRASRVGFPSCETREELPATAKVGQAASAQCAFLMATCCPLLWRPVVPHFFCMMHVHLAA
jgi:hypothetical protein